MTLNSQERVERDQALETATCQRTWKVEESAAAMEARKDQVQTSYRQHRCGRLAGDHAAADDQCRYCGELRS
jgi:hypothetical protein